MNKRLELLLFGKGKWWWFRHLLFWIFMYLDEIIYVLLVELEATDLFLSLLAFLLDVVIVYINFYVLIPRFFHKKKYANYCLLSLVSVLINVGVLIISRYVFLDEVPYPEDYLSYIIATLTLLATAIAFKIGKYYYQQLEITKQLKSSQSRLELNSLKQQINPHFLFNVLNTINVQSVTDPESVSETVIQLSEMLRYQIYDAGSSETVSLSKEIDFLKNYVALEKIRRSNTIVHWKEPNILPKISITPFLFLPIVENAFKHSKLISEETTEINIEWKYEKDKLKLSVSNTIGDSHEGNKGGFGIDNLKKRLDLLYPKKYNLLLSTKGSVFYATLEIKL